MGVLFFEKPGIPGGGVFHFLIPRGPRGRGIANTIWGTPLKRLDPYDIFFPAAQLKIAA